MNKINVAILVHKTLYYYTPMYMIILVSYLIFIGNFSMSSPIVICGVIFLKYLPISFLSRLIKS